MADILIRNLPEEVVADIDAQAAQLGLSRAEFVRRQLVREAARGRRSVSAADLLASDARLAGLLDDELIANAWR
ncbi:antitoxin [Herbiconiux sp. 11R-BC]|uniref:type II toxin-antitoxin system VapB family antitoxin n=1 Tax=Herbiconiux sp. 11R-BC TaxID=3111637 RepID=UPI003C0D2561